MKRVNRPAITAALALCAAAAIASPAAAQDPEPAPAPPGPTIAEMVMYGVDGGDPGYVKQFGSLYMYVNVPDTGVAEAPTTVKDVTADVSSVGMPTGHTMFQNTNIPLDGGWSYGTTWWGGNWRARQTVPENTYPWTVTATDWAGNSTTQTSTFFLDNTKPSAKDVQTQNKSGGVAGKAEQGDTLTFTWSEPMAKFVNQEAGWDHVVRIDNSGSNDILRIFSAGNNNESTYFGTVKLGKDYVSSNRTFGAGTTTKSRIVRSGNQTIVTLGTPSGTTNKVTSGAKMTWTPTGAFDRAANKTLTTTANELGAVDVEF